MPDMPNLTVDVPQAHVSHTWETTRCPLITLWNATWRRANTEPKDDLLIEHGHLRVPQQIQERIYMTDTSGSEIELGSAKTSRSGKLIILLSTGATGAAYNSDCHVG